MPSFSYLHYRTSSIGDCWIFLIKVKYIKKKKFRHWDHNPDQRVNIVID